MLYESEGDLKRERELRDKIEFVFKCKTHKFKMENRIDIIISRDKKGVGFGELKAKKSIYFKKMPDCILNEDKLLAGQKWAKTFLGGTLCEPKKLPFLLFIRCFDGDFYADVTSFEVKSVEVFRAKNHIEDIHDAKRIVRIPNNYFKEF